MFGHCSSNFICLHSFICESCKSLFCHNVSFAQVLSRSTGNEDVKALKGEILPQETRPVAITNSFHTPGRGSSFMGLPPHVCHHGPWQQHHGPSSGVFHRRPGNSSMGCSRVSHCGLRQQHLRPPLTRLSPWVKHWAGLSWLPLWAAVAAS